MKRMNKLVTLTIVLVTLCTIIMPAAAEEDLYAAFSASSTSGYTPLTVTFYDESPGSPTAWKWSFGDGSPLVTEYNPTHTYTKPGVYTVKETVSNAFDKDTAIKTDYITVKATLPVADFYASKTSGNVPLKVQFTDKSTGSPTEWKWSFGDGSALVTQYNPTYTYTKPGTYTVKETVSNAVGKDTEIKTNYITVTASLKAPVADFSASKTSGNAPLTVKFTDKSTESPTAWKWSFGDGSALVTQYNPTYTYSKPGTYTVKETVSNAAGKDTEIKTNYITVKAVPSSSNVYISGLRLGASGETLNQEYVQITNKGTTAVSMKGWKITDKGAIHTYKFASSYTLKAKTTVTLYTGKGTNTATKLFWGKGVYVWNNEGDTAYLYNAQGTLVSKLTK
jgi:PKD repeat protein